MRVAQARVTAARIDVQRYSVQQLASCSRVCIHELDVTGVKDDGWGARRVAGQSLWFLAIEQHAALVPTMAQARALLSLVVAVLDERSHAGKVLILLDQGFELVGAEAARHCDVIQCFEQAGLALTVVSRDDVQ